MEFHFENASTSTSTSEASAHLINFSELEIESYIGQGKSGVVFDATWRGNPVVVKFLGRGDGWLSMEPPSQLLTTLRYPNLVCVLGYSFEPDREQHVLVNEKVTSHSLAQLQAISMHGHLDSHEIALFELPDAILVMQKIAAALEFLHLPNVNVLHKGLKPSNVFVALDEDKHVVDVKVGDFGLGTTNWARDEELSTSGPEECNQFMAPEALSLNKFTQGSDVYSFGMVCYWMLTGGKIGSHGRLYMLADIAELTGLVQTCLRENAGRPAISFIRQKLDQIQRRIPTKEYVEHLYTELESSTQQVFLKKHMQVLYKRFEPLRAYTATLVKSCNLVLLADVIHCLERAVKLGKIYQYVGDEREAWITMVKKVEFLEVLEDMKRLEVKHDLIPASGVLQICQNTSSGARGAIGARGAAAAAEEDSFIQGLMASDHEQVIQIRSGDVEIQQVLQSGSDFTVHRGYWRRLEMPVAVKVVLHGTPTPETMETNTSKLMEKFRRPKFSTHPHVLRIIAFAQDYDRLLSVMELMEADLQSYLLNRTSDLPIYFAVDTMLQIAEGIKHLHADKCYGVVRPANIWIREHDGSLSFVEARITCDHDSTGNYNERRSLDESSSMETPRDIYMAPDVTEPRHLLKGDVYSFGVICAQILTRRPPFETVPVVEQTLVEQGLRPTLPASCPQSLENLIWRCCDTNPLQRPAVLEIMTSLLDIKRSIM